MTFYCNGVWLMDSVQFTAKCCSKSIISQIVKLRFMPYDGDRTLYVSVFVVLYIFSVLSSMAYMLLWYGVKCGILVGKIMTFRYFR